MQLTAILESLLVASEEPLPTAELARLVRARAAERQDQVAEDEEDYDRAEAAASEPGDWDLLAGTDDEAVTGALAELNEAYEESGRAFVVLERAKGWKIFTKPEYSGFVRQLFPGHKPRRLSGPAMETLAIVAYRQPVTKAAIEAIRGVSCDGMLQKLLDLELVNISGRADLPGRPMLYGTTEYFFEHFGIKTVEDLPNAAELRHVPLPEPEPPAEEEALNEEQLNLEEPAEETPEVPTDEEPAEDFATPPEAEDADAKKTGSPDEVGAEKA